MRKLRSKCYHIFFIIYCTLSATNQHERAFSFFSNLRPEVNKNENSTQLMFKINPNKRAALYEHLLHNFRVLRTLMFIISLETNQYANFVVRTIY